MSQRIRLSDDWAEKLSEYKALGLELPDASVVKSLSPSVKIDGDRKVHTLSTKYSELDAKYKQALRDLGKYESIADLRGALKEHTPTVNIKVSNAKSEGVAVVVASDWHVEEEVDPSKIEGIDNVFNLDIAEQRAKKFFANALFMVNMVRTRTKIDTLVLALLGDFISGYIHEELEETNLLSPIKASMFAQRLLKSGIQFLLDNGDFKQIIVPCCHGNHGRSTQKMRTQSSADNSYEYWIYQQLQEYFAEKDPRVKFMITEGYHTYLNVFNNFTIRFHHGDNLNFAGGIGGVAVPANKAIDSWNTSKRADLDVFGHFHKFMDGGNFICNGSLIGMSPYGVRIKCRFEPPRQSFFIVDRDHGKTVVAPIFVSDP